MVHTRLLCSAVAFVQLAVLLSVSPASANETLRDAARGVRQVIAHRGASGTRPECTLASVAKAIEARATAVEVDVRTSRDGALVIMHDATVDRTTSGSGRVADLTLAELKRLDAGSWFDTKYKHERVPTLDEVLIACGDRIDVLLDLKETGQPYLEKVAASVRKHGREQRIIVGVRSAEQAREFRRLLPKAKQLGLIPKPEAIEAFAKAGVETIRLWPRWLKDTTLVGRVRKAGCRLHLNGSDASREEVVPLLQLRPDSLSSDFPARLRQTLDKLKSP